MTPLIKALIKARKWTVGRIAGLKTFCFSLPLALPAFGLCSFLFMHNAAAIVTVDVHSKSRPAVRLGVHVDPELLHGNGASEVTKVIANDLESTKVFVVNKGDNGEFLGYQFMMDEGGQETFLSILEKQNIDHFLAVAVENGDGRSVNALVRIWSAKSRKLILDEKLSFSSSNLRRMAHDVADLVMLELFGYREYFNSKILHVVDFDGKKGASKRLAVMDRDGSNLMYLNDFSMVTKPTYSSNRKEIFYVSYANGDTRVKMLNVKSGVTTDFSAIIPEVKDKQILSPQISRDGMKILFSMSSGHDTDVYLFNSAITNKLKRVTKGGLNVSPSFAPDGEDFVFSSNMAGKSELYVASVHGGKPRRISKRDGAYYEPKWSPDGGHIAFNKIVKGKFYIGVMKRNGSGEKILYSAYSAESPSWSPNSRTIVFSYQTNPSRRSGLKVIDLDGRELMELHGDANLLDPFWFVVKGDGNS